MVNRTYLWVIFSITLVMMIASGVGLIYFYPRQQEAEPAPVAAVETADEDTEHTKAAEPAASEPAVEEEETAKPDAEQEPAAAEEPSQSESEPVVSQPEEESTTVSTEPAESVVVSEVEAEPESAQSVTDTVETQETPVPDYYYWVSAAETATVNDAEKIQFELSNYEIQTTIRSDGDRYEVLIGPYTDIDESEYIADRIEQFAFIDTVNIKITMNR